MVHCVWFVLVPRGELGPDLAIEHIQDVFERGLKTKHSPLSWKRCRAEHQAENMVEVRVRYQECARERGHQTGTQAGGWRRRGKLKVVKGRVRPVLVEHVGECAEPGAAFDDDGAILPVLVCGLEQVAGAITFQGPAACAETDKAERSGLMFGMQCYARLFASAIVVGRVERLVRVDGASTVRIATAGATLTGGGGRGGGSVQLRRRQRRSVG